MKSGGLQKSPTRALRTAGCGTATKDARDSPRALQIPAAISRRAKHAAPRRRETNPIRENGRVQGGLPNAGL